jgi:hypothetical protein
MDIECHRLSLTRQPLTLHPIWFWLGMVYVLSQGKKMVEGATKVSRGITSTSWARNLAPTTSNNKSSPRTGTRQLLDPSLAFVHLSKQVYGTRPMLQYAVWSFHSLLSPFLMTHVDRRCRQSTAPIKNSTNSPSLWNGDRSCRLQTVCSYICYNFWETINLTITRRCPLQNQSIQTMSSSAGHINE